MILQYIQQVKQMKKNNLRLQIFCWLAVLWQLCSSQPIPQCSSGFFYQTLPLTPDQNYVINLENVFKGYNLAYSLENSKEISQFVTMGQKIKKQKEEFPDTPLIGLKNYHLQKKGNTWGQSFIALSVRGDRSTIHYGLLTSNKTAPVINNHISVENYTNTTCFDGVLYPAKNLIIVDCVERLINKTSRGQIYRNFFAYYFINNASFVQYVKTELYVNFENLARRKLDIYSDPNTKHTFLMRTYFADGIQLKNKDNTYIDVFMIDDPKNPWVVSILDRTFLGTKKLRIIDTKIYLGEVFILDEIRGLYRVFINAQEDLIFNGFYEARGFNRFSVYSNNLDNHFELALANKQSIYEINWSDVENPLLINKYSLMPGSLVSQVFLNERFVFVQSSSSAGNLTFNYTWVFNRGDRTYSQAVQIIKHGTANTFIDLNEESSFLIIIDDEKLVNYAFDTPTLTIKLKMDQDLLDSMMSFNIVANSTDPNVEGQVLCRIKVNFTLLVENNRTMWPIGAAPPSFYNANYPGKVKIQLSEYVLGPNISYSIQQTQHGVIKFSKIFQQEQMKILWDVTPPFVNISFLASQTFSFEKADTLMIYMQDVNNISYTSTCYPDHENIMVSCNLTKKQDLLGKINNWATTSFISRSSMESHHIVAYTTSRHYNMIFINDLSSKLQISQLNLGKGFLGNLTSSDITGKYLFAILKYIKTINIYDLDKCLYGQCKPICEINHKTLYAMGLKYFNPTAVHSSVFHQSVIFIKTTDRIIAMDISQECKPKLLDVVIPVADSRTDFNFEVNSNYMVVTIAPSTVLEYDLSRMYFQSIKLMKKYPLYGYKLPRNYDFDISDHGNCVYLSTTNEGGVYSIFVYRSGYPAVGTLYNQIDLFAFQNVLIDASGNGIDYVTVLTGKQLRIFRQYEYPLAEIENPSKNYSFYLNYYNTLDSGMLQTIDVKIINLPTYIKVNPFLNNIMNTNHLLYSGENQLSEINDTDWYQGNVLYIRSKCNDCPSIIKVNNHINIESVDQVVPEITDFQWNQRGGTLQTADALLHMHHNGSVKQYVNFPHLSLTVCTSITTTNRERYEISGCVGEKSIILYVTSFVGNKAFNFQPYESKAQNLLRLQTLNEIVMLVDSSSNPYQKSSKGGVYLYSLSPDVDVQSGLQQLQFFNGDDFRMPTMGQMYINYAELSYSEVTKSYKLYISQLKKGLFLIEFTHNVGLNYINVKQITFLDVNAVLTALRQTLPYDATYQAIKVIATQPIQPDKVQDTLILTTGRFHTFQLEITYANNAVLLSMQVTRIYLRYAYYMVQPIIKFHNEMIVLNQVLPKEYDTGNQSSQIFTVYSTRDKFNGTILQRGLIGAYPTNEDIRHNFDFNLTLNMSDQHAEPRNGLVILPYRGNALTKTTLHRNLSVFTTQIVDTQIIYIELVNDFSTQKIRILINGLAPFPQWKLITIILFSIIGFVILVYASFIGYKKYKEYKQNQTNEEAQNRDTLITEDVYN